MPIILRMESKELKNFVEVGKIVLLLVYIAPHAPYSLKRNQLIQIMEFSKEHETDVQMHVAESEREEKFTCQLGETSSVSYLNSLNLLNERLLHPIAFESMKPIFNYWKNMTAGCPTILLQIQKGLMEPAHYMNC